MSNDWLTRDHFRLVIYIIRWSLIAIPVAAVIGSACALFLWLLDWATATQWRYPWLLYGLPLAGIAIVVLYRAVGRSAERGNNLIMDEIHEPGAGVPAILAPLVLLATVVTHLFGGSAGREGTAIQMGGSIAGTMGRWLRLNRVDVRKLLMVGIAAGFGGVFGTPLAGAVFAMEVIAIGRLSYEAIFPCLVAGIVASWTCAAWGITHTHYHIDVGAIPFEWLLGSKVVLAAIAFGLVGLLFARLTHGLHHVWARFFRREWLRPVAGALVLIALVHLLGTRDYLGLGVSSPDPDGVSILSSFEPGGADALSWWWKLLFTAITLSCGFKGGEVTPLFFIGATLGNTLAWVLHAPVDLFAGLGFVAVFAGATNTPLACTLMGIELFGAGHGVYLGMACFIAYLFSGQTGIYTAQRQGAPKLPELPRTSS